MLNLAAKRIAVTGGAGFLGRYVVSALQQRGCEKISVPRSCDYDLVLGDDVRRFYADHRPQVVFHLAARVGGIGANRATPGSFFYENLMMGTQLMEEGRRAGIEKFVAVGTVCSYPKLCEVPFREESIWAGYPEETNAPYGLAKKMLVVQSEAYRAQYGFSSIVVVPANLYGPGDSFDLETSHVIPALIRKIDEAEIEGRDEVQLWGSGEATREFLYAADAAEGLCLAAEQYDRSKPLNLGTGREISIRELAHLVAARTGYSGRFAWDTSQPDGQPRRAVDARQARELLGWVPRTTLEAGLEATIRWWRAEGRGR